MEGGMTVSGGMKAKAALSFLQAQGAPVLAEALHAEAWHIMRKSIAIVPFENGILAGTGDVSDVVITGDKVQLAMGYGGAAEAYAVVQHERLDYRHAPGRQAKYLEQPMLEAVHTMPGRFARYVERAAARAAAIAQGQGS